MIFQSLPTPCQRSTIYPEQETSSSPLPIPLIAIYSLKNVYVNLLPQQGSDFQQYKLTRSRLDPVTYLNCFRITSLVSLQRQIYFKKINCKNNKFAISKSVLKDILKAGEIAQCKSTCYFRHKFGSRHLCQDIDESL